MKDAAAYVIQSNQNDWQIPNISWQVSREIYCMCESVLIDFQIICWLPILINKVNVVRE